MALKGQEETKWLESHFFQSKSTAFLCVSWVGRVPDFHAEGSRFWPCTGDILRGQKGTCKCL